MNKPLIKFVLGILFCFGLSNVVSAQNNCPNLGPDQYLPCGQTTATLVANFSACIPSTVQAKLTTTYSVTNIPFAPQPTVGATNVVLSDDSGTGALPIGFTFCFFGNSYTQFYIGSNGWVSFSPGQSTAFTSAAIPSTAFSVPRNCVMGPWQDWHPGIAGGPYICYQTLGTAPCRRLVVSWRNVPMYSCTSLKGTFQIILYETTNLIENHITNKPNCPSWAGGTGVQGIHNLAGNVGITVPGRNSTQWTATNDAWRYVPNGAVVTPTLSWYVVGNPVPFATGSSVVVTPAITGNSYTCKQDYGQCNAGFEICSAMPGNGPDTVFVLPQAAIIPTITAPTCAGIGSPTTISCAPTSATNTYMWSGPSIVGPNNSPTITINGPGNYTCAISSTNSACNGTAAVSIALQPTVTIASSSPSMCAYNSNNSPNSVSLTASGAPNYTWSGFSGVANTYSSTTTPFITLAPTLPVGIGTVMVEGSNGTCSNSAVYSIAIVPNPSISITNPSVCAGNTVDIIASGASSFTWNPSGSNNATLNVTAPNTATVLAYSAIGSSLGCNSTTENAIITVIANPTVNVAPTTNTICYGQSLNLTATGANNYTWTPPNTLSIPNGPNVVASPSVTTNYTVIGEASTCTTTAFYQVSVVTLPSIVTAPNTFTICQYDKVNIYANGASSYTWSPIAGLNTSTGGQVTAYPNVTTVYNITGNNGACNAFGQVTVYVVPFPNVNISTPNQKICEGQSTTIFASGAQSYSWSPSTGLSSNNSAFAQANPSVSTNYTITGINYGYNKFCPFTKEILIDVLPKIDPKVSANQTICAGQSVNLLAEGSNTYSWSPASSLSDGRSPSPVANPTITTIYTVQISYYNNCMVSNTVQINVNPTPTVDAGEDFVVNLDEPMHLNGVGSGTVTWIAGQEIMCPVCPNSQIFPTQSGNYTIRAVNEFGCIADDVVHVEVTTNYNIYIPNIFTPNEDGLNDVFIVYGTGLTKFEMIIFDRWGEKLFVSKDQLTGWDGTYKGKLSKNDVYPYLIHYTSLDGKKHTKSGHVTLMK